MRLLVAYLHVVIIGTSACTSSEPSSEERDQHPLFYDEIVLAQLKDIRIDEASGLAESMLYPGHFWIHNDSGDDARLFLVNNNGETVVTMSLQGITHRDWEDIATAPGAPGEHYIYLGEIGDNDAKYPHKNIYRLQEPVLPNLTIGQTLVSGPVSSITFQYEDGNRDAETVMVDPLTNNIYLITKRENQVQVYVVEHPQTLTDSLLLPVIQTLPFTRVTAGDISADGFEIIIKTLMAVYYWQRKGTEPIHETLARPATRLPYLVEPQGEAIAWLKDGSGYITVSEKANQVMAPKIYFYKRK